MVDFFKAVGLTSEDVGLKVNSRGVLAEVLAALGVPEDKFAATCVLVDKLEKVPLDALAEDMAALGLERATVEALLDTLGGADGKPASLDAIAAKLEERAANAGAALGGQEGGGETTREPSAALADLRELMALGEAYGYKDWLVFDPTVVRGLAYYTGVVFEAFDRKGELRAIAGGGRYDTLLTTFGASPADALPAAGFGFGDAVIVELLRDRGLLPDFSAGGLGGAPSPDCVVYAFEADFRREAVVLASELREAGFVVDLVLEVKKPKWVFKHADRLGAKFVVAVAPDEWARGEVLVKPMLDSSSTQSSVRRDGVVEFLEASGTNEA